MREFSAVVLGAGGVGKSALTLRFMKEVFVESYDPTIEASSSQESYKKSVQVDGEWCSLEVLDTAGVEQFTALNEYYIQDGAGFILVFSLTQATSMREVENLRKQIYRIKNLPLPTSPPEGSSNGSTSTHDEVYNHRRGLNTIPIVIVGTKSDITQERDVSRDAVARMATLWGVPFYETSAKRNIHVYEAFMDILRQMRALDSSQPSRPPAIAAARKKKGTKCVIQ